MIGPQQVSIGKTAQLVHYFLLGLTTSPAHTEGEGEAASCQIYDDYYDLAGNRDADWREHKVYE